MDDWLFWHRLFTGKCTDLLLSLHSLAVGRVLSASPSFHTVSFSPHRSSRWVQASDRGAQGAKWLSEANTVRVLSSDPSPGDLEQLRACVCRRGWRYRCRSVCYPGYGEEVVGIRGRFQTRGLRPVASTETQGTAASSFLRCRGEGKRSALSCQVLTWGQKEGAGSGAGEGMGSGWGAGERWIAGFYHRARAGQRFASLHYVLPENRLQALPFISFLMS